MLSVQNLSFAYNADRPDAIIALREVDLAVAPGELVAIIGHNGSGKSTLAKILCAILEPTSGSFTVDGLPYAPAHIWEIRRRVGMVFQRPDDQLIANTIIDDVSFGPENLGLPRAEIERRVREVLVALDLSHLADAQISELSGGERQRVAIAGVLAMQPSYVILDEPTTMIAPRQARQLLALARKLRDESGVAVLHITHFMHETVGFDRIVVMNEGRVLMQGSPREIFARAAELAAIGLAVPQVTHLGQRLRAQGVDLPPVVLTATELVDGLKGHEDRESGRQRAETPLSDASDAPTLQASHASSLKAAPLLKATNLQFTYMAGTPLAQEALRGVDCVVYEGETLALLGGTQAGKSTLIEFFNGLRRPITGQLRFEGDDVAAPGFDMARLSAAVGMVFQQPETQLFEEIVGKDVSFAPRRKGLPPDQSRAIVEQALNDVGLDYEGFRLRYVYALSGGQKRRVALAGVLAAQPRVLILDEPVAGLDPRGRDDLARLIADLCQRQGLTVILVGNAIDELAELATRAIVLHEGRVALQGSLRSLMARADELYDLGLELSEAAEIARVLRPHLPGLPADILRIEELESVLLALLQPAGQRASGVLREAVVAPLAPGGEGLKD